MMILFRCPVCGHTAKVAKDVALAFVEPNKKFDIGCSHKGRKDNEKPAQMRRVTA